MRLWLNCVKVLGIYLKNWLYIKQMSKSILWPTTIFFEFIIFSITLLNPISWFTNSLISLYYIYSGSLSIPSILNLFSISNIDYLLLFIVEAVFFPLILDSLKSIWSSFCFFFNKLFSLYISITISGSFYSFLSLITKPKAF